MFKSYRSRFTAVVTDDQRVNEIRRLVREGISHPYTFQVLNAIFAEYQVPARDYELEVSAIFDWVKNHFRYTRDNPYVDEYRGVRPLFEAISDYGQVIADCDDYVIGLCSLLGAAGYMCKARIISATRSAANAGEYDHIYALVGIPPGEHPTRWIPLDATVPESYPGWEGRSYLRPKDYPL